MLHHGNQLVPAHEHTISPTVLHFWRKKWFYSLILTRRLSFLVFIVFLLASRLRFPLLFRDQRRHLDLEHYRYLIYKYLFIYRDTDPGHHILDTLEQCIAVIVEKAGGGEQQGDEEDQDGTGDESPPPANTKIIYFMPRYTKRHTILTFELFRKFCT